MVLSVAGETTIAKVSVYATEDEPYYGAIIRYRPRHASREVVRRITWNSWRDERALPDDIPQMPVTYLPGSPRLFAVGTWNPATFLLYLGTRVARTGVPTAVIGFVWWLLLAGCRFERRLLRFGTWIPGRIVEIEEALCGRVRLTYTARDANGVRQIRTVLMRDDPTLEEGDPIPVLALAGKRRTFRLLYQIKFAECA